jgi:hypothetical protein
LSATQTIDGIALVADDRVLVKNQTSAQNNGVYVVAAGAWSRSTDANTATEIAAAQVPVLKGTDNGGKTFITNFKSTDTLGTTAMSWDFLITATSPTITTPTITDPNISGAVMTEMASSVITPREVVTASGTAVDFIDIPSWVKRITVMFNGLSTNAATNVQVQLGTGGTPQTTGYGSCSFSYNSSSSQSSTTGLVIDQVPTAVAVRSGHITICNLDGNTWTSSGVVIAAASASVNPSAGYVSLSGLLNMIRITTISGTATFDAGTVNIFYE